METNENKYKNFCAELSAQFERKTRDNGDTFYTAKDDSLAHDLVRACHDTNLAGLIMPSDFIYEAVNDTLSRLGEYMGDESIYEVADSIPEIADLMVPVYDNQLAELYQENRVLVDAYAEAYAEESGHRGNISSQIKAGLYNFYSEIVGKALDFIKHEAGND